MSRQYTHQHLTLEAAEEHRARFSEVCYTIEEIRFDKETQMYTFYTKYWGCD